MTFEYTIDPARKDELISYIEKYSSEVGVQLDRDAIETLVKYDAILLSANEVMNLTTVASAQDVASKHFADSLIAAPLIEEAASVIDVGTGAGFPGLVLKIARPDIKLTLLDSLRKRCDFLGFLCSELEIEANIVHARAEEAARQKNLRDSFDMATTRAVANAIEQVELSLPFVKIGGEAICYKGQKAQEEFQSASNAIKTLGGGEIDIQEYNFSWGERSIIRIQKKLGTAKNFPRRPGEAKRNPIV